MPAPRFVSPIAAAKIRRAPPPPSIYELLEQVTTRAPAEMTETTLDVAAAGPTALGSIAPPTGPPTGPSVMESLEVAGIPTSPSVAPVGEPVSEGPGATDTKGTRKARKPTIRKAPKTGLNIIAETEASLAASDAVVADADLEAAADTIAPPSAVANLAEEPIGDLPATLKEMETRIKALMDKPKVKVSPAAYVPANRRAFKEFIITTYRRYKLPPISDIPNPNACAEAAAASKTQVKEFAYQEFVRDYIQRPSPYRGVLVYHGLGSGKTCTSIAGMEALAQAGQKPIYVMTPASLSPNYRDEITKCGPFVYRTNNHWVWIPITNLKDRAVRAELEFLTKTIGIPLASVKKRRGGWVPDPNPRKKPNFDKLTPDQRLSITSQINEHMDSRIQFIHYNGLLERQVRDWACNDPTMFDGSTIIIEEVHNLIRTINNSALDLFYKDEPRDLVQYKPKFCDVGKKYRISYLLYRMLCSAVGCKIIALSATPIINFAQEVAILANVLAGDTRMAEVNTAGLANRAEILRVLERNGEVDFAEVIPRPEINASMIRITPVPSGCRKVADPKTGAFRGFIRDEVLAASDTEVARERDVEGWFERVKAALKAAGIDDFTAAKFISVPRLPDTEKHFRELFIDTEALVVKPRLQLPLMARLSGLISYYKGGKADLMAKVNKDEVVLLDMSDLQLKKYTEQRKAEIDKEQRAKKQKKPAQEGLYAQISKNINSTFKIFSRASCNFVFPADYERPIPADFRDVLRMIGVKPNAPAEGDIVEAEERALLMSSETDDYAPPQPEEVEAAEAAALDAAAAAEAAGGEGALPPASYAEALTASVAMLRSKAAEYFTAPALNTISPKFQAILDRLAESKGPALIYSNFKTLEGVGLMGVALETQQNYRKFDIVKVGDQWRVAPDTLSAGPDVRRYITYTGDEEREKRNILLAIFNGKWGRVPGTLAAQVKELAGVENNYTGTIIKVIMITQSGAEGISLANVRQVHIMEPYWNYVRLDQVKGRAIRICSHMDLPPEDRNVDIFTYVMKFSQRQLKDRLVDETLNNFDGGETTDQTIMKLLLSKKKLSDSLLDVMKKSAVDCELNSTENGGYACYRFAGAAGMEPLFNPLVDVHINEAEAAVRSTVATGRGL
jgi:hypothetical protein